MLGDFMIPISANPRHIYDSALPQMPSTHLIRRQFPQYETPVHLVFGDPVASESKDLRWKFWCKDLILDVVFSPTGTNILVATTATFRPSRLSLQILRMEDGSLIQKYPLPHPGSQIHGMGFLSGDGDAVASWFDGDCFVYYLDGSAISVTTQMGMHRAPSLGSEMAITENTLALWDSGTPCTLRLINTTTWTEDTLDIPHTSMEGVTELEHSHSVQLAFAPDSVSLMFVRTTPPHPHVLVMNWRTKELKATVPLAPHKAGGPWDLYLFPSSSPFKNFAILYRLCNCSDDNCATVIIPLAGLPLPNDTIGYGHPSVFLLF